MADGVTVNGVNVGGGVIMATAEMSFSGDTMQFQLAVNTIISGTEGSWSPAIIVGGAGAVAGGVQRMTLASDDPAVALLGTINTDTSAMVIDLEAIEVLVTAGNAILTTIDADTGNIATSTAAAAVSLAIMDDWAESDRAKVNIIAGQVGIAGGAGVDGATVPRMTLATDVPLPAGTNPIGMINGLASAVDGNNSLATPLNAGVAFTGTATDTLNYSHVTVSVFADQVSATDGLSVEWSSDGTNWDNFDRFTIAASTGKVFSFGPVSRWMRVVYTNGGVNQAAFRLETILRVGHMSASSHRITDSISGQDDAELVKAVVTGMAPDTTFKNLLVTNAGEMKISLENVNSVTVPVSNAGTFVVQEDGAALTALQLIDDTVAVLGTATYSEATTSGNVMGVVRNDVLAPLADTDNEIAPLQVDAKGALWITPSPNVVDDGNSRTTNLAGGATFTGTGVDTLGFAGITINLFSDQDGATDGMRFEFSSDNSAWTTSHRHDYTANNDREFQFTTLAQFFRVVFINGATPTGTIRIQTILHQQTVPSTTIHRLDDSLAPDRSAQVVKASLMAQAAGSGNFVPINSTAAGNLKVAVEEFDSSLPSGNNNIGDVDIATIAAGTTTVGGVISQQSTSIAYDGTTACAIKEFMVIGTTNGNNTIIGAVAGKRFRLLSLFIIGTSTTGNTTFLKNDDNDVLGSSSSAIPVATDADGDNVGGISMPNMIRTTDAVNEALVAVQTATAAIIYMGTYIEVDAV